MTIKKIITLSGLLLLSLCIVQSVFTETIVLKSGNQVEGEKIEQTDEYIKIDFYGIPVTYYFDDIQSIDGKAPATPQSEPLQNLATEPQQDIAEPETTTSIESEQELDYIREDIQSEIPRETITERSADLPQESTQTKSNYIEKTERLIESRRNKDIEKTKASIGIFGLILQLILSSLMMVSLWKIFVKAGQPGWAIIIPFYNQYTLLKIAGKPGWWLILLFIPIVNLIVGITIAIAIAEKFGKSTGYGIGLAFLPFIFFPMLAFGDAQYNS
jgi:uncharacterized protein DUF5684